MISRTPPGAAARLADSGADDDKWTAITPVLGAPQPGVVTTLQRLRDRRESHPLWRSRLVRACEEGTLGRADHAFIFSQYLQYSRGFTRHLAALMTRCEDDLLRAHLSQNLWEESGSGHLERRHAELFRAFLRTSLGVVEPDMVQFGDSACAFSDACLDYCLHAEPAAAAAFLSLGTVGIVPRLYDAFIKGLLAAGIPTGQLEFFHLHVAADEGHARTLENIMLSYAWQPGWEIACEAGMQRALDLRLRFFERLFDGIASQRVSPVLEGIGARRSLQGDGPAHVWSWPHDGEHLYENEVERLGIRFTVQRLPMGAQVLDPRIIRIPKAARSESQSHAHETIFHVLAGHGCINVGDSVVEVMPVHCVFVPRWAMHQAVNLGEEDLVLLAITDSGLTSRVHLGDEEKSRRLNGDGHET